MTQRYKVAQVGEVPPGTMKAVAAGLTPVLLVNVDGTIYALNNICTHLFVPLNLGKLEGNVVTCLAHGSKFDVRNGEVVEWVSSKFPLGAEQLLKIKGRKNATTYRVSVEGNDVYVEV